MILVLGGTSEGRALAGALHSRGVPVVSSLAGRVASPRLPPGEVRIGGFGGVLGLVKFLVRERVSAVVDATHPYAVRMTAHAAEACAALGTPLLVVRRPAWPRRPSWRVVPDLAAAAEGVAALPGDAAVLVTTGRQGAAAYASCPQRIWLRAVERPDPPLPARCTVLLDRGPYSLDGETALLREIGADLLVTKNSGGRLTVAKLEAAERLGVPVLVVGRPPLPAGIPSVPDVEAALDWVSALPPAAARP